MKYIVITISLLALTFNTEAHNPDVLIKKFTNNYLLSKDIKYKQDINFAYEYIKKEEGYNSKQYKDVNKQAICHGLNFTDKRYNGLSLTKAECRMLEIGYIAEEYIRLKKEISKYKFIDFSNGLSFIFEDSNLIDTLSQKEKAVLLSLLYNRGATRLFKDKEYFNSLLFLISHKNYIKKAYLNYENNIKEIKQFIKKYYKNDISLQNAYIEQYKLSSKPSFITIHEKFIKKHLSLSKDENNKFNKGIYNRRLKELKDLDLIF